MSRFIRTLARVGLVELNDEEQQKFAASPEEPSALQGEPPPPGDDVDRLLRETESLLQSANVGAPKAAPPPPAKAAPAPTKAAPPPTKAAPPPPPVPAAPPSAPTPTSGVQAGLAEGRPFAEIYANAGLIAAPYPAEKLLRLLDGLRAMEPAMRKAAVLAMDAADDDWTIDDPLQDAQRKIRALREAVARANQTVTEAEGQAARELAAADSYQQEATTRIRAQIAELEQLLTEEVARVASERATTTGRLQATREAAAREVARLEAEAAQLNGLLQTFSAPRA